MRDIESSAIAALHVSATKTNCLSLVLVLEMERENTCLMTSDLPGSPRAEGPRVVQRNYS
jgi:hypothetical protein